MFFSRGDFRKESEIVVPKEIAGGLCRRASEGLERSRVGGEDVACRIVGTGVGDMRLQAKGGEDLSGAFCIDEDEGGDSAFTDQLRGGGETDHQRIAEGAQIVRHEGPGGQHQHQAGCGELDHNELLLDG